jgi:hypothetical protein
MNERIRMLAEQSGIKLPADSEYNGHVHRNAIEKLAVSIVQECAGIAYEYDIPNLTGPGEFIGNRMKKHFGVK